MSGSITSEGADKISVNKAKLDSLDIYEISEDELEKLGSGGSDNIFLNFAIFALSMGTSFLITLFTITITSQRLFVIFLVITILGFFVGIILLILWGKSKVSLEKLINKIKGRMKKKDNS